MVEMIQLKDREEWLQYRGHTIGGSDASAILGLNPWMSNADLYRIKTGEKEQEDISDKPVVKFGIEAEALMRELFRLDYPELKVFYKENNLWKNSDYPFAHASLDGWLEDQDGRKGIWECKTVNIQNSQQTEKWRDAIPDYYYTQLLHYFMVTGFDFAILKARLRWEKHDDREVYAQIKHYRIERPEVEEDLQILIEAEKEFYNRLETSKKTGFNTSGDIEGSRKKMELKIEEVQLPEQIKFNFEELKTELTTKAHEYKVTVYTEDKIKEAKSDRASLNKLKKALNDERIRLEKEYMKPFNTFKSQINEIIGIVDEPIGIIDGQIKDFEQRKKDEKRDAIIELWNNREKPEFLENFDLFNEKWLNSTYTMAKVEADIDEIIAKTMDDLKTLESLPEFGFEAVEEYKRTLSLQQAIAEGKRLADIQKRKEEQERLQKEAEEKARLAAEEAEKAKDAEMEKALQEEEERIQNEPTKENVSCETSEPAAEEPTRAWVGFKALLSKEEARALGEFITAHNIKIKKIEL